MAKFRLSPSKLNTFNDCPRCFYLSMIKKIDRPRGIYPSLPSGMDLVIKDYYDGYRKQGKLPPQLEGKIDGVLVSDFALLHKWQNWRTTNLKYENDKAVLTGALDDCIITADNLYAPLDNKTKGSAFKEDPEMYAKKYYQLQLDCYTLMLEESGYKTNGKGYFVFYHPEVVMDGGVVTFGIDAFGIDTNKENAVATVARAVEVLERKEIPETSDNCEYCKLVKTLKEV